MLQRPFPYQNTMRLTISSVLALLFLQNQALPTNNTLENFVIPGFIPISSGADYKLCTQGCWPAALICLSPAVVCILLSSLTIVPPSSRLIATLTNHLQSSPKASGCVPVTFTSPLLEWYTRREFGAISLGCTAPPGQPDCWTCCLDITPVF